MASLQNLVGQILDDKYQIDQELGKGGMGAVYKATHLGTERPVALKVIMPEFMEEKRFIERFKREAKAAGRLSHPNVVNVTDFGFAKINSSQVAYLVMEYLDGSTLGALLEKHKILPLELIVDIVEQTALAINEAHKQGIVHRDLKPDNIWLQPNGRGGYIVKVLDFGLAQLHDLAPKSQQLIVALAEKNRFDLEANTLLETNTQLKTLSPNTSNPSWVLQEEDTLIKNPLPLEDQTLANLENAKTLANIEDVATLININKNTGTNKHTSPLALEMDKITQVGAILGTPIYMSPEQCQGHSLDFRSDIYSLGVIVYQMLAGSTPFIGKINRLLELHIKATPPSFKNKGISVSPAIEGLIMSTLAKDPSKRPSSVLAFAAALKANSDGEVPIISQALFLYRKNFTTFLKVSFLVYLPYLAFYFLLIGASLALPINFFPSQISYLLTKGYWVIGIIALLIAHSTSLGIFAIIVEKLQHISTTNISIIEVLKTYFSNFIKIIITALTGNLKLLLNYSLYAPIIILEKKTGKQALLRSEYLVNQLKPIMIGLQIRSLFVSAITLVGAPITFVAISILCFILSEDWAKTLMQRGSISAFIFIPSAFILFPGLFLILVYPVIAIAECLFYFKTKLILGEATSKPTNEPTNTINQAKQPFIPINSNKYSTYKRTVAFLSVLIFALVSWLAVKDIALLLAATSGFTNVVESLIIVGANANSRLDISLFENKLVTTPLIQAVPNSKEKPEIIYLLLKNGANVNVDNENGWTPLMEAVSQNDLDTTSLLIDYGADVNASNSIGWTPLMQASRNGNLDIVELLLNKNADVNKLNKMEQPALMLSVEYGHPFITKALLEKNASINLIDYRDLTPLSIVAKAGDSYTSSLLIKKGADVNYQTPLGVTPLMIATINNNLEIVRQLLQAGAKTTIKDKENKTALDYAESNGYLDILELLKNPEQ
ncbi:MAG: ankyrin repeat domain-containing protein [Acidobacteria bacterium]|nr:ankyrin repeat domain-containing protein [Acidobacteriota bacterium]